MKTYPSQLAEVPLPWHDGGTIVESPLLRSASSKVIIVWDRGEVSYVDNSPQLSYTAQQVQTLAPLRPHGHNRINCTNDTLFQFKGKRIHTTNTNI